MQAWGEIVVCKVLNGVISEHTVETTRKCVVGNHVPGVRWHGFQPPASAVHCMITSKSQSLWASVLWCVNWWQQFSSPDKIPPSIGGYLLIPPTLSNLVFQEDNRKRFMEMLAKDPPTVTFLPGQASFPKAQKKIASMLYLIHWTDAKKKKTPLYTRQKDDHGMFSTPEGPQTLIKWWQVSMISIEAEMVSLETEVQKKFAQLHDIWAWTSKTTIISPDSGWRNTVWKGMKAWKVPRNTEPLELQTQESSCKVVSRMTAEALETWMKGTYSKNSTRAGRQWHLSGSGVTWRWLSKWEVATVSSFIVSMSLSLCLFLSSFFFNRKWSGRQVSVRIHSYPKRNCRYWDS